MSKNYTQSNIELTIEKAMALKERISHKNLTDEDITLLLELLSFNVWMQDQQLLSEEIDKFNKNKEELIHYKSNSHYWEAQFKQLKSREKALLDEVEELKAQVRKREQQLFGRSSEKKKSPSKNEAKCGNTNRPVYHRC